MLVVCLAQEPTSLYRYADNRLASEVVLQAIYDGPIDFLDFEHRPVILEKVPSLADGDAAIASATLASGDIYWNPMTQLPENLRPGKTYIPSGCQEADCLRSFQGGEVQMDQMTADFRLLPGLQWSDGAPLTAADSVLSYELDGARDTPSLKYLYDRTESYAALDERTVRWTGIPGFLDAEYAGNFWSPLPAHLLGGLTAAEVLAQEQANRTPIGWGPYRIKEWVSGEHILLEKNPSYFRAVEGLPAFDQLLIRFVPAGATAGVQQLLTGECDVLDEGILRAEDGQAAPSLLDTLTGYAEEGRLSVASATGALVTSLDFNLTPAGMADRPPAYDRRVREAVDLCLDREALIAELFAGLGGIPVAGLPPGHPLAATGLAPSHDPVSAIETLTEAGWLDSDADPTTARTWSGGLGIPTGTALGLKLTVARGEPGQALGEILQRQLSACGIGIEVIETSAERLAEPWPDGPVFGRAFEAVLWSWPTLATPACDAYATWEIPGEAQPLGINATGFSQPAYDAACRALLISRPEGEGRSEAVQALQEILALEMPSVAVASPPRIVAHAPNLCGLAPNPSALTGLWNLEAIRRGEACP
jgi:peptide/nickel transport system substrate-binding protein